MGVISRLAEKIRAIAGKRPAEEVKVEAEKGRVLLLAKELRVKMELFKLFPKKRAWGFELVVENRGERELKDMVVWFTHSKHANLEKLLAGKIALKSVEFSFDEVPLGDWEVRIERVAERERLSSHFTVPLQEVFRKFKEGGKVDVIEEGGEERKAGHVAMAWKSEPAVKQEIREEKPADVEGRMREIEHEKEELVKQFMRREIDYQSYSQLMNALNKELLELKTKVENKA